MWVGGGGWMWWVGVGVDVGGWVGVDVVGGWVGVGERGT